MLYLFTAMYCEASTLIKQYHLKKETAYSKFQVFYNTESELCLTITGTGMIAAAAAVSSICTKYGVGTGDFLVNIGIAAGTTDNHAIYLCNKIIEDTTNKTFYPDILYRHTFEEMQIVTGARPCHNLQRKDMPGDFLYDMESSSIYQAGTYFFGPHQMSFLKIVSDQGEACGVMPKQAEGLVAANWKAISEYLGRLRVIGQMEKQKEILPETADIIGKLCEDMHCSKVMSASLGQHIRYLALTGQDYASVIKEMYQKQKLPCKDKKEGKIRFEELKRRFF